MNFAIILTILESNFIIYKYFPQSLTFELLATPEPDNVNTVVHFNDGETGGSESRI